MKVILLVTVILLTVKSTHSACANSSNCTKCEDGYILTQSGKCIHIKEDTRVSILFVCIISIGSGLLIASILLTIFCCVLRKSQIQKNNESAASLNLDDIKLMKSGDCLNQKCSICLQDHAYSFTKCKHCFHSQCLLVWRQQNNKCPMCRAIINGIFLYCEKCENYYEQKDPKKANSKLCKQCRQ